MTDVDSNHHIVTSSNGKKDYRITINYTKSHWCDCRGMISMKSKYGEDSGRTFGTSCIHIKKTIRNHYNDDWGTRNPDGSRTTGSAPIAEAPVASHPAPAPLTGRRAAHAATVAKREVRRLADLEESADSSSSLLDRIDALESSKVSATG